MPNDNLNKKNSSFVAELKAKFEKQTQEQQQAEIAYKELVKKTPEPSSSTQETSSINRQESDLVYTELKLRSAQLPFKEKSIEDTEYAKVLVDSRFIIQADELKHKLQSNFEEIEKLETKIKDGFASGLDPNTLNETKIELRNANVLKHDLQFQLQEIREPLNNEFANNYKHAENKVADLEERIKDEHGGKYSQLKSELILAQKANISLIQKNIVSEQGIANSSKDDELKATAEVHIDELYNKEFELQNKLLENFREKKDIIGLNIQLHLPETSEFVSHSKQFDETLGNIVHCVDRISVLDEILNKEKAQSAPLGEIESQYKDNPYYVGQEQIQQTLADSPPVADRSKKPKKYLQSAPQMPIEPTSSGRGLNFEALLEARKKEILAGWEKSLVEEEQKPPSIDRTKKPSRLAGSSFFSSPSSSSNQDAKEKEKEKISSKGFSYRQ